MIDRDAAARLGINTTAIDNALNNAYSQRQVSTIYAERNQYKVVLEIDPKLQTDPSLLVWLLNTTRIRVRILAQWASRGLQSIRCGTWPGWLGVLKLYPE